jgi:hypothetical protein
MANYVSVIQNGGTGVVDYLEFSGPTLVASAAFDYGIAGFRIVADGEFNDHLGFATPAARSWDLVAQNVSNPNFPVGQLDFLFLDNHGNLIGSALSAVVPTIQGEGQFGTVPGQTGPTLVSQLPNGALDMLAFNASGALIATDLIPGTVGLPRVVGIADFGPVSTSGLIGGYDNSVDPALGLFVHAPQTIVTQLPSGQIDLIGLSGSMATGLLYASSNLLPTPVPPVQDVNPTGFNLRSDFELNSGSPPPIILGNFEIVGHTVQMVSQLPSGQVDQLLFDATTGAFTGSQLESFTPSANWLVTDGGTVGTEVLPLTAHTDYPGFIFL